MSRSRAKVKRSTIEVERVRAVATIPADVEYPWQEDDPTDSRPPRTIERLIVDEEASIARARAKGRREVLPEDLVQVPIEVPIPYPDREGTCSGMLATLEVDVPSGRTLQGDELEAALWEAAVPAAVSALPDGRLRLSNPASEFDVDKAVSVIEGLELPTAQSVSALARSESEENGR